MNPKIQVFLIVPYSSTSLFKNYKSYFIKTYKPYFLKTSIYWDVGTFRTLDIALLFFNIFIGV